MTSPLIIVVLAVLLRIERIGWRRTLAVAVGFLGVLLIVRPEADGFNLAANRRVDQRHPGRVARPADPHIGATCPRR